MRRLIPLVFAVGLLLSGCGTERPAASRESEASFGPAPSPTVQSSPAAAPGGPLSAFPLAYGFPDENGDDHSPVEVTDTPATRAFAECGRQVWDPRRGSSDVIGVEFRGEAEWFRGRTLVRYPTTEAASTAVETARYTITNCPRDDGDDYGWAEHTEIDFYAGEQSFGWIDRWWTTEVKGFDTGLTVYHVVRVGHAVLFSYEYGEGNGSEQTRLSALSRAAKEDQTVVDAMRDL